MDPDELPTILEMSWPEYFAALQVQFAHWQTTWPAWPVSLDERYDRTWVATLLRFRADTQALLRDLPREHRAILVGYLVPGTDLRFFGHLTAAGRVSQVLLNPADHPAEVDVIEGSRAAVQRLPFRHATPAEAVAPWERIANMAYFGPAASSRLLLAERPDLYFILNGASREGMEAITGHDLPQLLEMPSVGRHYRAMLEAIYTAPWWRHPPPADPRERLVWDSRVALLDVFAYDPEVG
jgi:hypothetical protein